MTVLDVCRGSEVYASACSVITQPFVAVRNNGLENSYVWSPETNDAPQNLQNPGKATFLFSCSTNAVVTFKVEGSAPHGNADSFYMAVDGGAGEVWHYPNTKAENVDWHWKTFSSEYYISEGIHELHVIKREDGTKLRRVGLVKGKGTCIFDITGIIKVKDNFWFYQFRIFASTCFLVPSRFIVVSITFFIESSISGLKIENTKIDLMEKEIRQLKNSVATMEANFQMMNDKIDHVISKIQMIL